MKARKIITTEDGSQTFVIPELGENYHSVHGAIQESKHVYIDAGLKSCDKDEIVVFEMGFGTGLNALLSYQFAHQNNKRINYLTVEKYPLTQDEIELLQYENQLQINDSEIFSRLHAGKSGTVSTISEYLSLQLFYSDIKDVEIEPVIDVCYFDAFAPEVQPELWTPEIFQKIYDRMNKGGILTTYSAKGIVRRNLMSVGFRVEKIPGPPGKREIIRAIKD